MYAGLTGALDAVCWMPLLDLCSNPNTLDTLLLSVEIVKMQTRLSLVSWCGGVLKWLG